MHKMQQKAFFKRHLEVCPVLALLYFLLACWLAAAMLGALLLGTAALATAAVALASSALKLAQKAGRSLSRLIKTQPLSRNAGDKRPKS